MARMDEMDGRKDGAYTRLFGDERLGHLLSQAHAATIRAGTELEKALIAAMPKSRLTTIPDIAAKRLSGDDVEIVYKPAMPKSGETPGIVTDFAVFFHSKRRFFVVELKDGDTFDTQKAPATKRELQHICDFIRSSIWYAGDFYVCSFNAPSKETIVTGFKNTFDITQVMTGQELCFYLGVDYEEILAQRQEDQEHNKYYLLGQVERIKTDMSPAEYFEVKRRQAVEQLRLHWVNGNE